ncbi:hypothetical protein N7517_009110 [Penicillium concentricum]|uniref:Protein kinase domain-containing protein n=1 Tax=Penicillium concentricum TaxID=293559 RepID=A0A9W9UX55_9EURO|nr:uncharacterized protein N7517_009110 [Penicillium concentricum]KAJ5359919.1 hypothetical protein N7517_009110 [Penicillium concentricum]
MNEYMTLKVFAFDIVGDEESELYDRIKQGNQQHLGWERVIAKIRKLKISQNIGWKHLAALQAPLGESLQDLQNLSVDIKGDNIFQEIGDKTRLDRYVQAEIESRHLNQHPSWVELSLEISAPPSKETSHAPVNLSSQVFIEHPRWCWKKSGTIPLIFGTWGYDDGDYSISAHLAQITGLLRPPPPDFIEPDTVSAKYSDKDGNWIVEDCEVHAASFEDLEKHLEGEDKEMFLDLMKGEEPQARLFTPLNAIEENAKQFGYWAMSSEKAVENYERNAVENYVHNIIEELCKIEAARKEIRLGDGIQFENHTNLLDADEGVETTDQPSKIERPKADSFFFIHRVDGDTHTLLATAEYKPPHKLSVSNKIPTDKEEKLKYDAKRLVCSAIVQEYHVMIQEGLEYSYVTTGIARVLLRVPRDNPSTLYYHFCDPNPEVDPEAENSSKIPKESQPLPNSDSTYLEYTSPESGSAYESSSSPPASAASPPETPEEGHRVPIKTRGTCAPSDDRHPVSPRAANRGNLDDGCPNVKLHRRDQDDPKHPITSEDLVRLLKEQLDDNIDRCIPFGRCGSYGAPFKLTCIVYGYTVVGKGTTSNLWKQVSSEAQVYRILRKAQGSAVPVFLGTIDLAKIYFLHRAGEIRHMLVMGWGGENTAEMEMEPWLSREIRRSTKEIKALGVVHDDLRYDNILWNQELGRALIIDFHRATLTTRPLKRS